MEGGYALAALGENAAASVPQWHLDG